MKQMTFSYAFGSAGLGLRSKGSFSNAVFLVIRSYGNHNLIIL